MKKFLCLFVALVMGLSLCACGSSADNMKANIIGTWNRYYEQEKTYNLTNTKSGDQMLRKMELYRGGTGYLVIYNVTKEEEFNHWNLTWEIVDGILNVTNNQVEYQSVDGFEYDATSDKLVKVDGSWVFERSTK